MSAPVGTVDRPAPSGLGRSLIVLEDVLDRFAALSDEPEPVRSVRGMGLAVAQHWLITLPAGPARDKAIDALGDAVALACEACSA